MSYSKASLMLFLSFVALAASGCGGGSPTPSATATPCVYNPNAVTPVQLVYPIPGATSVPTNIGVLVYGSGVYEPVYLEAPNNTPFFSDGQTAVPSPLPSPAATPVAGETLFAAKIGTLASNTIYTAVWTGEVQDPCTGSVDQTTYPIGSFTTQ